jgi:putative mRNA 3-end processing factor
MTAPSPETWIKTTPKGLYCVPGDFYVDPARPVGKAVITHGHGDHARPRHERVLATPETIAIMESRFGAEAGRHRQALRYGEPLDLDGVRIRLVPAGHILGSAQIVIEWRGSRIVVSGDYKRRPDPTCPPFEPISCDVFITEATFALPVFRHPDDRGEVRKILESQVIFPDRCQAVGVYALGKCQRMIRLLRELGHDGPLYLHGALAELCDLYEHFGIDLGDLRPVADAAPDILKGAIVLAPPGSLSDRWSRRLPDPVVAIASGWMGIRARARQRGAELPLVVSDHADWDELTATLDDVAADEVWITHGRDDALAHYAQTRGQKARALALIGRDEESG